MTANSTNFFNEINFCSCKSCIIAEAKKLENNSATEAFQLLHDAELYYAQITKELQDEKKALYSRLNENERNQLETIESSNKNKGSINFRCHPPLNAIICGKHKIKPSSPERTTNGEFTCPVAVFESKSDPRQKPMYPKHLVYKDGKDVQLEEIRAALYWERVKKRGTPISNQAPSENENCSAERINASKEEIKPVPNTSSKNVTDLRCETNPHDAVNQRKPEGVTASGRSPSHKCDNSNIAKLSTASEESKHSQAEMNKKSITSRLPSRTANHTNQAKPEVASRNIPRLRIGSSEVLANKKQSAENDATSHKVVQSAQCHFSAADNSVIEEHGIEEACSDFESSKLENAATQKSTAVLQQTYVVETVQENVVLQQTYVIENKKKLPVVKSEKLNNEAPKTPKRSNFDDISKLFENSCLINSAAKEQRISKAVPVNNEDKENVLPIQMIQPPWDEEEDNSCNTKAFSVMLPSSTPNKRRSQFFGNGLFSEPKCSIGPRASLASATLNLSMIPETSREKSSNSSGAGSVASVANSKNLNQNRQTLSAVAEEKSISSHSNNAISDPFDPELLDQLLERLQFPCERHQNGYHPSKTDIFAVKLSNSYKLGSKKYTIAAEIGKGSYARILKAFPTNEPREQVAMKVQKPACVWEYYISKEIFNRLKSEEKLQYFLHYSEIFVFPSCSIMLSEWGPYGSLLNYRNAWKTINSGSQDKYPMVVAVYLSIEILSAVQYLHSCRIIHGDIKPDNFIISTVSNDGKPSIKLIDFGRSIDMTLFPSNTVFQAAVKTEDFTCNEMKDGRPWTYQTDLFGMAGTFYVLLMGEYMKTIAKSDGLWVLKKPLARYMSKDLWDPIFMTLLNVPSCNELPDLAILKIQLESFYDTMNGFEKRQQFHKMLPIFRHLKTC